MRGQVDGVGAGLLLDDDDHGGLALVAGVAALHPRREVDLRHLVQEDRLALAVDDDRVAQVLQALGQADVADQVLAPVLVDEAAARVGAEARDRRLDLLVRDVQRLHGGDVRRDPVLAHLAADRDHLRDARDGEELRPDHEVGELAHLHGRDASRSVDGDQHDLAHDGGDRPHLRVDAARELLAHERQALGDELARAVDVGAPVELDVDDGQADAGDRAHAHARPACRSSRSRAG